MPAERSPRGPATAEAIVYGERALTAAVKKHPGKYLSIELLGGMQFRVTPLGQPPSEPALFTITNRPSVYILEAPPLTTVKIGYVASGVKVVNRIERLQTGCPYELHLVVMAQESRYLEGLIHWRFAVERQHGEWFERSERVERLITLLYAGKRLGDAIRDPWLD